MRCEEARRRLRRGADEVAEAHLADCAVCFEVLERQDALVPLLRQARPEIVAAPAGLMPSVISRWQRRRRLPWVVAAAVVVAATVPAAALIWLFTNAYSEPLVLMQISINGLLKPFADTGAALLDVIRARFIENPDWLTALLIIGGASAAAFAAIYRELGAYPRQTAS